jgi:hypothetical protein
MDSDARHSRLNCGTSTSAPAWNVSRDRQLLCPVRSRWAELVGKRLMSATFVTDIATVAGLTALFIKPTLWVIPFVIVSVGLIRRAAEGVSVVFRPLRLRVCASAQPHEQEERGEAEEGHLLSRSFCEGAGRRQACGDRDRGRRARPGHAAEVISHLAEEGNYDLSSSDTAVTSYRPLLGRLPTASPSTRRAR